MLTNAEGQNSLNRKAIFIKTFNHYRYIPKQEYAKFVRLRLMNLFFKYIIN